METEKISIKHNFTDIERIELGDEQAGLLGKADELEAQLKSAKTQIQAQIDSCEAQIRAVSSKLRSRYEFRDIECLVMDHRISGFRHVVRTDTGHVVKARKLRSDETQLKISDAEPKPYSAIALLQVDDNATDGDFIELLIHDDEFEVLRRCPDVQLRDIPRAIPDGCGKKK